MTMILTDFDNLSYCGKCMNGFIFTDLKNNVVAECECRNMVTLKTRFKTSGITEKFYRKGFKGYEVTNEVTKAAKLAALDYANRFDEIKDTDHNSILISGQVGSGKTHLCIAILKALLEVKNVKNIKYMPYRESMTELKQCVMDSEPYKLKINAFKTADCLVVDDMCKGKCTDADINILFEIINFRYLNNLPLVISTEKTSQQLLEFDEAIMSRIIEMSQGHIVEIYGKNLNHRLIKYGGNRNEVETKR